MNEFDEELTRIMNDLLTNSSRYDDWSAKAQKAIKQAVAKHVIGKDERHDNGHMMVNDPSTCMECTNPDERFARNQFRAEQRQKLNLK